MGYNRVDGDMEMVRVEWVDSARPDSEWRWLEDLGEPKIIQCVSVGFLVHKDDDVYALAPNVGDLDTLNPSASGIIRIPTVAITSVEVLTRAS